MTTNIPLSLIRLDGGTQTRAELREDVVSDYAESYASGVKLPPVVVFSDDETVWMADGFHRYAGREKAGMADIEADIRPGTARDALLYSAGCNGEHGLRRTNEDKRQAVKMLLADEEWGKRSDSWVAQQCRVSDHTVASVRELCARTDENSTHADEHEQSTSQTRSSNGEAKRTGKDGKERPATKPDPLKCSRCQRGAQAVDCKACKALRDEAEKKKKAKAAAKRKANQREEMKDKGGNVLPDRCRDAFADPGLSNLIEELAQVEQLFRPDSWLTRAGKLTTHYGFILIDKFKDHIYEALSELQLAAEALKAGIPHAVCPTCKGADTGNNGTCCRDCRGYGHVPEHRYQELTK